jgi:tRNA(fMet)-specific endonuclease VapC
VAVDDHVLLDTNVAIYLATGHALADYYRPHCEGYVLALSFATEAELLYTSLRARDPARTIAYWRSTLPHYSVLFPDPPTCEIWARIAAFCHRRGRPREHNDLWIAATALRHGLRLVTHNRRDFVDIPGLTVISEAPRPH